MRRSHVLMHGGRVAGASALISAQLHAANPDVCETIRLMTGSGARSGRVARWEARQQAKFDRQQAEAPAKAAAWAARNVRVKSPRGRTYVVRAVKRGDWLVEDVFNTGTAESGVWELAAMLVHLVTWVPVAINRRIHRERPTQWTVGVVRYGGSMWRMREDVAVWKEHLPVGADEAARVAELAAEVQAGTLDVRTRLWPKRKL